MTDLRKFINIMEDSTGGVPHTQSYSLDKGSGDKRSRRIHAITSKLHREDPRFKKLASDFQVMETLLDQAEKAKSVLTGKAAALAKSYDNIAEQTATRIIQMGDLVLTYVPEHEEKVIDYESVVISLASHLTPELIAVLERLKKEYTILKRVGDSATIKKESIDSMDSKIQSHIDSFTKGFNTWNKKFGAKLNQLRDTINNQVHESKTIVDEGFMVDENYIRTMILNSLKKDKHVTPISAIDGNLIIHDKSNGDEYIVSIQKKTK